MKNAYFLSVLLISSLFLSCSSDSDDEPITPVNTNVTFSTVNSIMTSKCNNCHGNPTSNNAPISLTTSAEVESAIKNKNLIGRIENGTMPPSGTLSTSQIQSIIDWKAGGFK